MTNQKPTILTILQLLQSGKTYTEFISEGHIRVYYEKGKYFRHEYQTNPYGGETRDRIIEMTEEEITTYFPENSHIHVLENLN